MSAVGVSVTARRALAVAALACAALAACALPALAQVGPPLPRASTLSSGWEMREEPAAPGDPQQAPPEESAPEGTPPPAPPVPAARASQGSETWRPTQVPNVFNTRAIGRQYPGTVRRYRLTFMGPKAPPGFRWALLFEEVRRAARVYLNGRRIGGNRDPYTPFTLPARGLKPGKQNTLVVIDDSRKNPELLEGWWNWGGIVRPVRLIPVGPAYLDGLGTMSLVNCKGPARACKASLFLDGVLERHRGGRIAPEITVRLSSPRGRVIERKFRLHKQRAPRRRVQLFVKVPAPVLWSPDRPALYRARITLKDAGRVVQVVRRRVGLRSVKVKGGRLFLNNRRIQLRGASIHEDMPGHGAALTSSDMDEIVNNLKALHANVTRAHYLLNDRLLSRLDRAGIMVWNETPIWQRDHRANLLRLPRERARALLSVRRTVKAARSHPSVITHSVANELSFTPDSKPGTRRFLTAAAHFARDIDPTLPVSVDIKGRAGFPEQLTYANFDMLGLNEYYGWYDWVSNFDDLEPYLAEMRDTYPDQALVVTEFGAEARPEMADAPADQKGSYGFQAMHTERTLALLDRTSYLSGAIYWTLREFEIYPGWTGGAGRRAGPEPNTRHNKGLLTYDGQAKPAWYVARDHFARTPLYVPTPAPAPAPAPARRKHRAR
jgi:beta-galactosidase